MKVYIVTRGEYSDYRICAVFTKRKDAVEYVEYGGAINQREDDYRIEVWPVDRPPVEWVHTFVGMDDSFKVLYTTASTDPQDRNGFYCWTKDRDGTSTLVWAVTTDNAERAVKVVAEKVAQIKALGLWGKALHGRVK